MRDVDAATLRGWILGGGELAILDAREEGAFGAGHLFWAVSLPLAQRELRVAGLLPGRSARIVCVDDGDGSAAALAEFLLGAGYADVRVLAGGIVAWRAAGGVLFSGVNVPSKAFGEWVEHHYGTESIDAAELKAWQDAGRDMVVLDSRTFAEFRRMSIPSGISVPGGELVWRIGDLAPDPATLVVVNCAGRTRSIMGAESLRRAGIANQVVALRNGTMGWELAGFACAHGVEARFAPGVPQSAALARARAASFAAEAGVRSIGAGELAAFAADAGRTLYVLDVRDPEEFAAGHLAGSLSAPGGQLVQATDQWVAVRGARIALIDDDGVRARMAGAWLRLMGQLDVFVVEGGLRAAPVPRPSAPALPEVPAIDAAALAMRLAAGDTVLVDLARSTDFRGRHIPAAIWGMRGRLSALGPALAAAGLVVLTSPDGALARLAAAEAQALTRAPVRVLEGGTAAWRAAGHGVARDRRVPPDAACIDVHLRPYDRNEGVTEAMHAYLGWEMDLVNEIARDGTVHFGG
jgi:rhodanese-related sulfurtransferase